MPSRVRIRVGRLELEARFEDASAPRTCEAFRALLPFRSKLFQARWSGEAGWVPLGDRDLGVKRENATSTPAPGEILFHPPGKSECEILLPYGVTRFASRHGRLVGNHFLTVTRGRSLLPRIGELLQAKGAQTIEIVAAS